MTMRIFTLAAAGTALWLALVGQTTAGTYAAGASPSVFVPAGIAGGVASTADEAPGEGAGALSTANTDRIVRILNSGQAFCSSLAEDAYAVDCLAERMEAAAAAMPATGDYAEARAALLQGAARLNALARANADPDLPRATARQRTEGGITTARPLVPVDKARLAEVAAQAEQIVAETETLLLRSAESSRARKVHYARMAAAVGSNKILLRSI